MKIAITGLVNSGKTTVFNAMTGLGIETAAYSTTSGDPNHGVVKVPDARLEKLSAIFSPKKTTHSTVHYIDYLGITRGDLKQNRKVFDLLKDAEALVHVVRAFEDDSVPHPLEDLDPLRDVQTVDMELLFGDLELVEKRIHGFELSKKKGKKPSEAEHRTMLKCKEALEDETLLRDVEFAAEDMQAMRHLQFMSMKPAIVVLNISEDDLNTDRARDLQKRIEAHYGGTSAVRVITLSGKVEMEIAELDEEEAGAFLEDLGIEEPALNRLIQASYGNLGLISFFTVGEDECKAWAVQNGSDALNAAGKIHSDIQRGFIRAEVVHYDDFISTGGMAEARDKGLFRLEGKTYVLRDGDIINFRFNV